MANNNTTTTRPLNGGNGDDVITGDGGANVLSGGSGNDTLTGAGGDDVLNGDAGRDLLDGGAGSDRVDGHSEDDVLVYVAAENAGAHDEYDGGAGVDTLRLVLTREEWMRPAVQSDIAAFLAYISVPNPSGQARAGAFAFTAFDLKAGKFERLEVTVDGVALDPRDEAVMPGPDAAQADEDGTAAGAVLANDAVPDLVRSVEVVVPPANGTLVFNADGTYVYTPGGYFNSMAAGETAVETFQYRVTDADFDSAIAVVTVTITGTNDGPVVTNTTQELVGAVQEDDALTATGQLSASDVDHDATQTWTVEGAATGSYGSIAVDADGRWIYTLDNAAHQDLAQGESHQEAFTIRVTDDQGAFVDQTVTVSVAGTNDGPVITGGATSGSVTEDAAATQATGQLVADDPDHGAQQTWTVVGGTPTGGTYGALTVAQNGAWTYGIDNGRAATQALGNGQVATDSFTVQVADEFGAFDTRTIDVQVVGTNDGPVIQTADVSRALAEDANVVAGRLTATGDGQFSDVDLTDTHSVSAVLGAAQLAGGAPLPAGLAAALGGAMTATLLDPATGDGHAQYRWDFGLDNAASQFLAAGQALQVTYDVVATDSQGASAAQQVTITITGTNDAPVVTAADTSGAVAAQPQAPDAPPPPLVFTVQQFLNYQSNSLANLRNYVATHAADYTVQTNVIDYTDDPNGFAGELPGSTPWPAAQAQNVGGTGGINDVFFARITADFSVTAADTYTFRTFNDDGVFLLIDNQLILQDTGYHPEAPFTGSIALQPGNHTIELFFYENGGEASLEFSARNSTGSFGLVGASGGGLGGANVPVQDSGTIAFADVDLTDAHVVSAAPLGATLGTLAVAKDSDTTGTGTGGQVTWTYSVGNAALGFLAGGETRTESFVVTVDDQHGGVVTRQVDVTITGSNDAPVVAAADVTGAVTEMTVPAGNLTDSGTIAFDDLDLGDVHSVGAVTASPAALGALTATVSSDTTGTGTGGVVTWNYTVPAAALEFLGAGQTRVETFTFDVLDGAGGSVARTVSVTLTGTNDIPVVAAADVTGAVTEMIAPAGLLTNSGTIAFSDRDLADVHGVGPVTASAPTLGTLTASVTADTTGTGAGGVVTWNYSVPASSVEYLGANQTRVESFTFAVLDGQGGSVARTVAVTITGTNDKPVAVGDVLSATEDTPVTFTAAQLLGNDSDADANAQLSIASVTSGAGGTAVRNPDGSVTFKPFANFSGTASFSYVASDGSALSNSAAVSVAVAPMNDAPALTVPLSGATSMWNGEGNAIDLIGGNNGTLFNGTSFGAGHIGQAFSFDGVNDFARVLNQIPNDFTISAWINTSNTSRTGTQFYQGDGLIYADVGGVTTDFGISILNNRVAFGTGGYQDITIQSQSTVTTGQWVQFSAVRSGSVISLYVNGVLEASADTGYAGPLSAPSRIDFGGNTVDSRYYRGLLDDVTIYNRALSPAEIQSVVAGQPAITTAEDTARTMTTIRVSDVDAGADAVLVSMAAGHGSLALGSTAGLAMVDGDGSDGSLSFSGSLAAVNAALASGLTYAPDANFNGADQLSLSVNDQGHNGSGGAQSASQSVAITVTPVNDAPVAVEDANALTVKPLPSGAQSNFVNWVNWTSSAPGSVVGTIDVGGGQTIGVTYSGEFTFAQTSSGTNFYTDYDNNGSPTTTTYTSPAVQNGPTGADIIALSQATQKTLTFSQPVNDLFFAIVSLNGNGYLFDQDFDIMSYGQGFFGNGSATRVAVPDGRFSVVGSGELHGVLRIDGAVQSLTWTSQTPEYWNGFTVGTYGKAQTATAAGNLLSNDSDADGDVLAVSAVNGQQIVGNSVTLDLASGARVQVNRDGSYLYDEDGAFGWLGAGQTTLDSFQYTVVDGHGGSTTQQVEITIVGAAG